MCGVVRNQPCSFYYSEYPDAPQLEGNDTSIEIKTGPTGCEDLILIGHRLNGLCLVRIGALKVKITYCDLFIKQKFSNSINQQKFKSSHEETSKNDLSFVMVQEVNLVLAIIRIFPKSCNLS